MKAQFTFDLDKPEERELFTLMQKAMEMSIVLEDIDDYMRKILKYEEPSEDGYAMCERIRKELRELREEREGS